MRNLGTINKGTGLKRLALRLGVPQHNVIHIGDSASGVDNDMLIKTAMPGATFIGSMSCEDTPDAEYCCNGNDGMVLCLRLLMEALLG
jgi:hypothetical protein